MRYQYIFFLPLLMLYTHIWAQGQTYLYSVDTPEGQGLISTGVNGALPPQIVIRRINYTAALQQNLELFINVGQRTPKADVYIRFPKDIQITLDNTFVDIIGRGSEPLRFMKTATLTSENNSTILHFSGIDLRPFNGIDIHLLIKGIILKNTTYTIETFYQTSEPLVLKSPIVKTVIKGIYEITDLKRCPDKKTAFTKHADYSQTLLTWTPLPEPQSLRLQISTNKGKTWEIWRNICKEKHVGKIYVNHLNTNKLYLFRIKVLRGRYKGYSNIVKYYSGEKNIKDFNAKGDGITDDTEAINAAIQQTCEEGGGTISFTSGTYLVRTIYLKSNVWLHITKDAIIKAIAGTDAPELTWFSDRGYRYGLSSTDIRPYQDPENYLTKQDVGHTFFHNTMFLGERIENVKIVGDGRITGNGILATSDKVMNNAKGYRGDKMFTFKQCRNIEVGGFENGHDLWYDERQDQPYYIPIGSFSTTTENMLHIDQSGHFALLATGTDSIFIHDTWFGRDSEKNIRDIYDFMECRDVFVKNIYSRVSSDDIVKIGSDCSLGFTRKASHFRVRNIIGDTNCNLFQIGSETADDISNVYIDNIYVLGANKAGFSISTNDGAVVSDVHLNSGKTGILHHRSIMKRPHAPFFISISNRGRRLAAKAEMFTFREDNNVRKELLITNSPIGSIRNVSLKSVDISEVYAGSNCHNKRWPAYDGSQKESTSIITGYALPTKEQMVIGKPPTMPDGRQTGYVENISFEDINITVKGGHLLEDSKVTPPEIGVGKYNVADLKVLPSFGFWFRHTKGILVRNCTLRTESPDARYPIFMDDVHQASIEKIKIWEYYNTLNDIGTKNSDGIYVDNINRVYLHNGDD